jgi:hypothetical protein
MAYDYTGYGMGYGEPSEEAVYADAEAAFAYLVNVKKTPPHHIILCVIVLLANVVEDNTLTEVCHYNRYGRSLGSGPTTHLAVKQSLAEDPVAGVILQVSVVFIYLCDFYREI